MNKNLYNIHILGVGFMFVFSAFITASFIEAIVFKDFNKHGIDGKTGELILSVPGAYMYHTASACTCSLST